MFSDFSVNNSNGLGYNSVIEANSSSDRAGKPFSGENWPGGPPSLPASSLSLQSDCSSESSSLLGELYSRMPSSSSSSLSFALERRFQLAQGRLNPLVLLLCGRDRKAAFQLLPS